MLDLAFESRGPNPKTRSSMLLLFCVGYLWERVGYEYFPQPSLGTLQRMEKDFYAMMVADRNDIN